MTFWIIALLIALATAGLPALVMLRTRSTVEGPAAFDLAVYRGQLAEIDRDLARGVIGPEDADRVRAEIGRRVLAADAESQAATTAAAPKVTPLLAVALLVAIVTGSIALYSRLGVPGYPDLALKARIAAAETLRQTRPDQAAAEAQAPAAPPVNLGKEYLDLVQKLRDTVAARPDDLDGQALLARHEAATGRMTAAYQAQRKVIALKGDAATAEDYALLADMLILAAGGYVSPEAEQALDAALGRDRSNGIARYYTGLMMAQTGRPDVAVRIWSQLLTDSTPDAPWVAPIRAEIAEAAARAGIDFSPLPPLPTVPTGPGPTAEDVRNAAGMDAGDRQQMIEGMVQGLADRLARDGGPPEDWAKLINALGVLGQTDRARAIAAEARTAFAADPAALARIEDAARAAGVNE
ncbi:c-type cytochrome biogenesis protein CcmI [Seohaeicola nanhaiensis]|uniref:C-type cytochrome biogenesis protein CcmI n=1 Tax=Seohaeicola nanhaiensis TaxID=1387282 RepID=A0ABV9KJG2_9RHOB